MARVIAAYQPRYFPRLHYLARAAQADVFVIYDDVQFRRASPQNRAPIHYQGKEYLTVPVAHTGVETAISAAVVDMSDPWPVTHLETLIGKYGQAAERFRPFYRQFCPAIIDVASVRSRPDEIRRRVDDPHLVEQCLRWDERWREHKATVDDLRHEKDGIAARIAERKRRDSDAAIDDLVAEVERIERRLSEREDACRSAQRRRNELLLALSEACDGLESVEWASMGAAWDLDGIDPTACQPPVTLTDVTVPLLSKLFDLFDVSTPTVRSSDLAVDRPDDASEYLARITDALDGDCYLSGATGYENYLEEDPFVERGLDVRVQDWDPRWEEGNVCSLDVLFGTDTPGEYVRPANRAPPDAQ